MKKSFALIAAAAALTAGAHAQSSENFVVQGEVPLVCQANNNSVAAVEIVDLTITTDQTLGSFTYVCNNPGGFTRTFSSTNAGTMTGSGSGSIAYNFGSGGGSGLGESQTSLSSPLVTNLSGSGAFANGQPGSVRFNLPAVPTGLFAGTYNDTVTLEIAVN